LCLIDKSLRQQSYFTSNFEEISFCVIRSKLVKRKLKAGVFKTTTGVLPPT